MVATITQEILRLNITNLNRPTLVDYEDLFDRLADILERHETWVDYTSLRLFNSASTLLGINVEGAFQAGALENILAGRIDKLVRNRLANRIGFTQESFRNPVLYEGRTWEQEILTDYLHLQNRSPEELNDRIQHTFVAQINEWIGQSRALLNPSSETTQTVMLNSESAMPPLGDEVRRSWYDYCITMLDEEERLYHVAQKLKNKTQATEDMANQVREEIRREKEELLRKEAERAETLQTEIGGMHEKLAEDRASSSRQYNDIKEELNQEKTKLSVQEQVLGQCKAQINHLRAQVQQQLADNEHLRSRMHKKKWYKF